MQFGVVDRGCDWLGAAAKTIHDEAPNGPKYLTKNDSLDHNAFHQECPAGSDKWAVHAVAMSMATLTPQFFKNHEFNQNTRLSLKAFFFYLKKQGYEKRGALDLRFVPKDGCCEKCFQVCNKKKLLGLHMAALSKGQGWPMPVEVVILFSKAP